MRKEKGDRSERWTFLWFLSFFFFLLPSYEGCCMYFTEKTYRYFTHISLLQIDRICWLKCVLEKVSSFLWFSHVSWWNRVEEDYGRFGCNYIWSYLVNSLVRTFWVWFYSRLFEARNCTYGLTKIFDTRAKFLCFILLLLQTTLRE